MSETCKTPHNSNLQSSCGEAASEWLTAAAISRTHPLEVWVEDAGCGWLTLYPRAAVTYSNGNELRTAARAQSNL